MDTSHYADKLMTTTRQAPEFTPTTNLKINVQLPTAIVPQQEKRMYDANYPKPTFLQGLLTRNLPQLVPNLEGKKLEHTTKSINASKDQVNQHAARIKEEVTRTFEEYKRALRDQDDALITFKKVYDEGVKDEDGNYLFSPSGRLSDYKIAELHLNEAVKRAKTAEEDYLDAVDEEEHLLNTKSVIKAQARSVTDVNRVLSDLKTNLEQFGGIDIAEQVEKINEKAQEMANDAEDIKNEAINYTRGKDRLGKGTISEDTQNLINTFVKGTTRHKPRPPSDSLDFLNNLGTDGGSALSL